MKIGTCYFSLPPTTDCSLLMVVAFCEVQRLPQGWLSKGSCFNTRWGLVGWEGATLQSRPGWQNTSALVLGPSYPVERLSLLDWWLHFGCKECLLKSSSTLLPHQPISAVACQKVKYVCFHLSCTLAMISPHRYKSCSQDGERRLTALFCLVIPTLFCSNCGRD